MTAPSVGTRPSPGRCPVCRTTHVRSIQHWLDQGPTHPSDWIVCTRGHGHSRAAWQRKDAEVAAAIAALPTEPQQ